MITGFHPDPSICRVGDDFYLVTSSFEYFPGIPIFRSTDLVHWDQIGHCLTRASQLDLRSAPASGGLYAATIRWHDGRFFVTCTNVSGNGHFIVNAEDPAGPWSEPVWVDQDGIDPSLFFDRDGVCYFTSTVEPEPGGPHEARPDFRRGIQQCVVDPLTGAKKSETRFLWEGSGGRFPEAPHLFRRGEHYYLLLAEGGTEAGHMVTVARSTTPWGPWEGCPGNPVLSHRSRPSPIQSTGHADLVELADGSWWAVLLGTRPVGPYHHIGRETFLVPVSWDAEGWPVFGDDGVVPEQGPAPLPGRWSTPSVARREGFGSGAGLGVDWVTLRVPLGAHQLALSDGAAVLTLTGGPGTTDDPNVVAIYRRQEHLTCSVGAALEFHPGPSDEAGLTIRMDEQHHFDLAVVEHNGMRAAVRRTRIGPAAVVSDPIPLPDGLVRLRVEAKPDTYRFWVDTPSECLSLGSVPARYLSAEVAGGFTGVMFGLYATASESAERPAAARWSSFCYSTPTDRRSSPLQSPIDGTIRSCSPMAGQWA